MQNDLSTITFLGHAGFHIRGHTGENILIDPWITGNPALAPGWTVPRKATAILVTHGHSDHLDADMGGLLARTGATLVASTPVAEYVRASTPSARYVEMNKGGTAALGRLSVTMVDAVHEAWIRDPSGAISIPHQGAGFVVRLEDGTTLYHAGDTAVFGDMALIGRLYRPRIALLPIGGLHTMDPDAAALACELLGCQVAIPMHYGTFDFLTGTPAHLAAALRNRSVRTRMREMTPGLTLRLANL